MRTSVPPVAPSQTHRSPRMLPSAQGICVLPIFSPFIDQWYFTYLEEHFSAGSSQVNEKYYTLFSLPLGNI